MSRKRKEETVDLLEGFDFEAVFAGEIKGPEALVPERPLAAHATESKRSQNGVENSRTVSERSPEQGLNGAATESKRSQNGVENSDPSLLIGRERQLLTLLFHECQKSGDLKTAPLTIERIRDLLKASTDAAKTAIKRLCSKGLITRFFRKDGRSGWVQYQMPKAVYDKMFVLVTESKRSWNGVGTESERRPEWGSEQGLNPPSSSRDLYIKESTTTQTSLVADAISTLDLTQLREFGITHDVFKRALQLHPSASSEGLGDLVFRLGELFKNPAERKKIQNARGFVIKLVEQLASGIAPLDHIETPTDRLMREYADRAKRKRVEQQGFEDALLQEAFEKWDRETIEEDKFRLVPFAQSAPMGQPRLAVFREYFRENIWPECKKQMLEREI